jgi:hypothetical protein
MSDIIKRLRAGIHTSADENMLRNEGADEIERLRAALKECADDLEAEIMHRYGDTTHKYQREKQKRDQDMEPVIKARNLLSGEKK